MQQKVEENQQTKLTLIIKKNWIYQSFIFSNISSSIIVNAKIFSLEHNIIDNSNKYFKTNSEA